MSDRLERLLAELPFLAPLRADELHRAARRFRMVDLAAGAVLAIGAEKAEAAVVVGGRAEVEAAAFPGHVPVRARLSPGDHVGAVSVLVGRPALATIRAETAVRLGVLDQAGYVELEREFPVIALPACAALAEELAWKDELLRDVAVIEAERLEGAERQRALEARRSRVARRVTGRGARIVRRAAEWGEVLRTWGREPAFWMLVGFLAAFCGARLMVFYILHSHNEKKLFALHRVEGFDNPIHIHHFNYGLVLVTITSLLAFFPSFRKHLRLLALVFGLGAGLIFDEFALIWNLNPDYYQGLSTVAVVTVAVLLSQLAFWREPWERRLRQLMRRRRQA